MDNLFQIAYLKNPSNYSQVSHKSSGYFFNKYIVQETIYYIDTLFKKPLKLFPNSPNYSGFPLNYEYHNKVAFL